MIMATNTAEKTSLEIKRFINAPRDCVYAAWTDPAQLKEWFGPENVRTRNFTADARVGGKYRWDLINEEADNMTISGEYRELVPGKKIVFTWKWDDDEAWKYTSSVVTVELSDRDSGTELRLIHEKLPSEESRDRHNEGWNSVVDRLEKFFSK
jgi:glutathione S-transferase